MQLFKVMLTYDWNDNPPGAPSQTDAVEDRIVQRALLLAWRNLRLVAGDAPQSDDGIMESWQVWAHDRAMADALLRHLPLIAHGQCAIKSIEPCDPAAIKSASLPQLPHPNNMVWRQLNGLDINDVFPHYDNDDMGMDERFHYLWDVCRLAESLSQSGLQPIPPAVIRLRQGVVAMARALIACYTCDPAREDERRALEQRAVWLTEVGVDPEPVISLIRTHDDTNRSTF